MIEFIEKAIPHKDNNLLGQVFLIDNEVYIMASTGLGKFKLICLDGCCLNEQEYRLDADPNQIILELFNVTDIKTAEYIGDCDIKVYRK